MRYKPLSPCYVNRVFAIGIQVQEHNAELIFRIKLEKMPNIDDSRRMRYWRHQRNQMTNETATNWIEICAVNEIFTIIYCYRVCTFAAHAVTTWIANIWIRILLILIVCGDSNFPLASQCVVSWIFLYSFRWLHHKRNPHQMLHSKRFACCFGPSFDRFADFTGPVVRICLIYYGFMHRARTQHTQASRSPPYLFTHFFCFFFSFSMFDSTLCFPFTFMMLFHGKLSLMMIAIIIS